VEIHHRKNGKRTRFRSMGDFGHPIVCRELVADTVELIFRKADSSDDVVEAVKLIMPRENAVLLFASLGLMLGTLK